MLKNWLLIYVIVIHEHEVQDLLLYNSIQLKNHVGQYFQQGDDLDLFYGHVF